MLAGCHRLLLGALLAPLLLLGAAVRPANAEQVSKIEWDVTGGIAFTVPAGIAPPGLLTGGRVALRLTPPLQTPGNGLFPGAVEFTVTALQDDYEATGYRTYARWRRVPAAGTFLANVVPTTVFAQNVLPFPLVLERYVQVQSPFSTYQFTDTITYTVPGLPLPGFELNAAGGVGGGQIVGPAITYATFVLGNEVRSTVCDNDLDDDGDGFADLQDPGCRGVDDESEMHLRPGDVLAAQDDGGIAVLDPSTTQLRGLAAPGTLVESRDLEVDSSGRVFALDGLGAVLVELDVETGLDSVVSTFGSGDEPWGLALVAPGTALVSVGSGARILSVDLSTGVQTPVATDFLGLPSDLLFDPADGSLLSSNGGGVFHYDAPIGDATRTTIATSLITAPRQMVADSATSIVLADSIDDLPYRLDLVTSAETALLSFSPFSFPRGVTREDDGLYLFSDLTDGKIVRVSEANDTATVLDPGGRGPIYFLYEVPEDFDLALELSDAIVVDGGDVGVVDAGDTLELTAVVTNDGAATADLLSLESGLDPNLTLVASSLSTTQGAIVEGSLASDPRLEVDLGSLAPAASATVTWQVVVSDPAPASTVTANAWIRREKLILAESDDPTTGPAPDPDVIPVGDVDIVIQAFQKVSDTRGRFSGPGNPGSVLADGAFLRNAEPVGDLDADGVPDIALAEWSSPSTGIYLALMEADGTVKQRLPASGAPLPVPPGAASGDDYGRCLAYLGDIDGPGGADFALAVGAPFDNGGGTRRGAVHILSLQNDGTLFDSSEIDDAVLGAYPTITIDDNDRVGDCVASLGDLDGAGGAAGAIAVGASWDDDAFGNAGAVYVLFLNADGTLFDTPVKITQGQGGFDGTLDPSPPFDGDFFGRALTSLGDLDGDGNPELAVGQQDADEAGTDAGAVWVFSVGSNGEALPGAVRLDGSDPALSPFSAAGTAFGRNRIGAVSDLDGDGTSELLVGSSVGFALLYLNPDGSLKKVETLAAVLDAVPELAGAGGDLSSATELGDLDADGRPEIAIGAVGAFDDDGGPDRGAVYILYPDAIAVPEPDTLLGLASGTAFLAAIGRRRRRP